MALRVEGRAKADVVFGCGADVGGVGQAWQHVEGGGQHSGVSGDAQWPIHRNFLLDLLPTRTFVVQPLSYQVLEIKKESRLETWKAVLSCV